MQVTVLIQNKPSGAPEPEIKSCFVSLELPVGRKPEELPLLPLMEPNVLRNSVFLQEWELECHCPFPPPLRPTGLPAPQLCHGGGSSPTWAGGCAAGAGPLPGRLRDHLLSFSYRCAPLVGGYCKAPVDYGMGNAMARQAGGEANPLPSV